MRYEATATIIHKYAVVVPGLSQTEDFARFVLCVGTALAALKTWNGYAPTSAHQQDLDSELDRRLGQLTRR